MGLIEQWLLGPKNWLFLPLSLPTGATYFFPGRRGLSICTRLSTCPQPPSPPSTPSQTWCHLETCSPYDFSNHRRMALDGKQEVKGAGAQYLSGLPICPALSEITLTLPRAL